MSNLKPKKEIETEGKLNLHRPRFGKRGIFDVGWRRGSVPAFVPISKG